MSSSRREDGENEFLDKQKVYTVSLPPEGCLPNFDNSCESSSSVDSENNEEAEGNALRHRRRRKKKKGGISPADPQTLQRKLHGETVKSGTINKNKRRKLQRKRQKERMKAAGLLPRAGAVDFVYQPEEGVPDKETLNKSSDQATEDQRKKSDELLDFFQATQEIYFADSKSKCSDSALSFDIVLDILSQIKNAAIPPSDVNMLHHLKTLLLLQDIERLKGALNDFKEHSVLPFDQRVTICSLLHYWITDILPIQNAK
ncbi:glutamate-rich protein 1 isoform X2 [Bombina bombina]|uniref:glutamate-rich protein 1 isoform X2 n=1 Tax=Bombina bombina TaxID=8345 RepID=UPI00235AA486|nr:glutamate-rich protein 1 isoform X2 [Bombina bombina]